MAFEGQSPNNGNSPGGFEFGIRGWAYGPPVAKSITFFLDNTCVVCDQYGRKITRAVLDSGEEGRFADSAPDANREGDVHPRPQFATHAQVIAALLAEKVDWLSYEVRYRDKSGGNKVRGGLVLDAATKLQAKLLHDGCNPVMVDRTIACAGWPQLPYAELKKIGELPPTPEAELRTVTITEERFDRIKAGDVDASDL